jgi:hypothetical protein
MAQEAMNKRLMRVLLAVCATAFLAASTGFVYAQEDDDDDAADVKFLRNVLGELGLKSKQEAIEYRERSPLVLPPSQDLPPPASDAAPNAPNWPADVDAQRRKVDRAQQKKLQKLANPETQGRPLRPDEMTPGAATPEGKRAAARIERERSPDAKLPGDRLSPDQLGYKGGLLGGMFSKGESETAKFTREPERGSLTDPPVGYRTPSAAQPYGVTPDSAKAKAMTTQQALEKRSE